MEEDWCLRIACDETFFQHNGYQICVNLLPVFVLNDYGGSMLEKIQSISIQR